MFAAILSFSLLIFAGCILPRQRKDKDLKTLIICCTVILPAPILAAILNFELVHLPSIAHLLTSFLNMLFPFFYTFMRP